ncbi:hypothetical protein E6O75_ATG06897 [Venturia nashicola]|uniref:Uncharacterized protein n=1 Tax=Venturia nashicola TaxID=86259 RepID=A0A4Z1PCR8_9PEZI|nr:hypothetical protein E6O75_ATG06897 [Venturia nashicola]
MPAEDAERDADLPNANLSHLSSHAQRATRMQVGYQRDWQVWRRVRGGSGEGLEGLRWVRGSGDGLEGLAMGRGDDEGVQVGPGGARRTETGRGLRCKCLHKANKHHDSLRISLCDSSVLRMEVSTDQTSDIRHQTSDISRPSLALIRHETELEDINNCGSVDNPSLSNEVQEG